MFSAQAIGDILDTAERLIGFEPDIEITLANPDLEQNKFRGYRSAASIAFPSVFRALMIGTCSTGRIHNRDQALKAGDTARAAGFDNFNLDLMHGLPEQSAEQALADLQQAIALEPTHLSGISSPSSPIPSFTHAHPSCRSTMN